MKKFYIHPQTSSEVCVPANKILMISGGPTAEPAPARVNWGKNVQLVDIYFI